MTYETRRITQVVLAGVVATAAAVLLPAMDPWIGLFARGVTMMAIFGAWLALNGFLRPTERAVLLQVLGRRRRT